MGSSDAKDWKARFQAARPPQWRWFWLIVALLFGAALNYLLMPSALGFAASAIVCYSGWKRSGLKRLALLFTSGLMVLASIAWRAIIVRGAGQI